MKKKDKGRARIIGKSLNGKAAHAAALKEVVSGFVDAFKQGLPPSEGDGAVVPARAPFAGGTLTVPVASPRTTSATTRAAVATSEQETTFLRESTKAIAKLEQELGGVAFQCEDLRRAEAELAKKRASLEETARALCETLKGKHATLNEAIERICRGYGIDIHDPSKGLWSLNVFEAGERSTFEPVEPSDAKA